MSNLNNEKEKDINYRKIFLGIDVKLKLENGKKVIPIGFDNGATTPSLKCLFKQVYNILLRYASIGYVYAMDY